MSRANNDCIDRPHIHVGICQRAGYEKGRQAAAAEADTALARVEAVLARWDMVSRGESPTTAQIRAAIRGDGA